MAEYRHTSAHNRIRVVDAGGVRSLRFERNHQSSMRLDDPFATDIEYIGYLHLTRAVVPDPHRALVVGLGGGTFMKQLWRDCPQLAIDAVEIDAEVVAVARELFSLPDDERITVHVADGRTFLETTPSRYDIVVIDAFEDDVMPRHLTTEEFMFTARARMNPGAALAYNVIGTVSDTPGKSLLSLHRTASNIWRHVWTFTVGALEPDGIAPANVVLLMTDAEVGEDELLARIASRVSGTVRVEGYERYGEDLHRGALRSGDVPILTDHLRRRR